MRGAKTLFRVTFLRSPGLRELRVRGGALSCRGRGDVIRPICASRKTIKSRMAGREEAMCSRVKGRNALGREMVCEKVVVITVLRIRESGNSVAI
jgi:hypothetical protein